MRSRTGPRRGRIRDELVIGLAAVVLLSALATFAAALASSRLGFDAMVETNDVEIARSLAAALSEWYEARGGWDGIEQAVESHLREGERRQSDPDSRPQGKPRQKDARSPVVVTDENGVPLYTGFHDDGDKHGEGLPAKLPTARGEGIVAGGATVGYVFFKTMIVRRYNPQEAAFLSSLARSAGASVAVGLVLSLVLGSLLASRFARPVTALGEAVRAVAGGDLSARVGVGRRDEIGSLAEGFNLMADRLQDSEKARQELLADIAHELRTPVSVIQANLEMMLDGVYQADEARLRSLYEETRILGSLISDLRALSDLESGISGAAAERVRLSALVEESCAVLRPLFDEAGLGLAIEGREEPGVVIAEEDRLRQVLRNILGNALKYSPRGSTVSVLLGRAEREGRQLIVATITDEGPGVPGQDTERIFERFYRVDPSRSRDTGGRGLGLAICKRIIESSGGRIGARNREPRGLEVWFELPLATEGQG